MSTATVEALDLPTVRQRIAEARAARDAGMAQATDNASDWDKALIDQAIGFFAQTLQPFSANDIRPLLPADVNCRGLMGAQFSAAYTRGEIQPVGDLPSHKKNTHCKRINVWISASVVDLDDAGSDGA
ncbi:hypothetical protein QWY28_17175 [Nocardioides sp. SOB77]|uniref:Uncharacterized protein n=1 Tax=Nocardioides oceani TaxID=3058369 RepID=A0ABT8FJ37_9ACTN|nr:hypothetical protein [Nocardioides oceani]MDN4174697.1 hypothetical protein [Nocardioides oceani]